MPFHPGREWKVLLDETAAPATVMGDRLKALAEAGQIKRDTMITTGGLNKWIRAGQLKGLFPLQDPPPPIDASEAITSADPPAKRSDGGVKDVHATMRSWEFAWAPVVFVADFLKPFAPFALYLAIMGWIVWAACRFAPKLRTRHTTTMRHALVVALFSTFFAVTQFLSPGGNTNGVIATLFPVAETFQDRLLGKAEAIERNTAQTAENTKNIGTPKQESSDDPQKELMNLGISLILYPDAWNVAINAGDIERLTLLERAGYFPARLAIVDMVTASTKNAGFLQSPEFVDLMWRHAPAMNEAICYDLLNAKSYNATSLANVIDNLGLDFLREVCGPFDINVTELREPWDAEIAQFCNGIAELNGIQCSTANIRQLYRDEKRFGPGYGVDAFHYAEAADNLEKLERALD